jgi:hypothetical protein
MVLLAIVLAGCGPADAVSAGEGALELTLALPEGYHLNADTTSWVTWEVDGAVVQTAAGPDTPLTTLDAPVSLPVTFAVGEATAVAHLNIRYCSDADGMCLVNTRVLELPVQVAANGNRSLVTAAYTIVPPGA